MWPHDINSTVSESLLNNLQERYCIPEDYALLAPESGQRAYDPIPKGFALTLDALEAGLCFPLHPVISSCISWWRISPSQMAPNSWRYLVAFLGECYYANITLTRSIFLSCFHLSKGSGGYYLSARSGFWVSGTPSSNKGDWGFGIRWSACMIDNTAPTLNGDEYRDLQRLKEILPASRAIRDMTKQWLIEVSLSPAPQEMVNLRSVRGGWASSVSSVHPQTEPRVGSRDAPVDVEVDWPRKKAKTCVAKGSDAAAVPSGGAATEPAGRARRILGRGEVGPNREVVGKAPREPSFRELCRLSSGLKDEPYQARAMADLPQGETSDPLGGPDPRGAGVGQRGLRGLGHHYAMALMDRVRDAGRVVDSLCNRNAELHKPIEEIRASAAPEAVVVVEQRASDMEAEPTRLKFKLKAAKE
ncbi:hypothetical protein C4D60_Mb10t00820 [Musa balbisiana]|uniref:Transposase (putative) gypsy type domain-containing protein n=1 Tax=Musa balbisiana TaxID=52838 RepID=A0A4V4H4H2_MUSBA|nr:hypothetical protein C4D60_Mb10t00820 [Musa balbisiana]